MKSMLFLHQLIEHSEHLEEQLSVLAFETLTGGVNSAQVLARAAAHAEDKGDRATAQCQMRLGPREGSDVSNRNDIRIELLSIARRGRVDLNGNVSNGPKAKDVKRASQRVDTRKKGLRRRSPWAARRASP